MKTALIIHGVEGHPEENWFPFHPSLRLNKLKSKLEGLWSISIDMKYRIIFKPLENGVILFISAELYAIYENN